MPGKHVHFVDGPSTPSSTFSASTLSSSSGPATPPPVWYSPPASTKSSLSSPYLGTLPAHIQLHPLLAATDGYTPLDWDMSLPAESSHAHLARYPPRLTDTIVSEPATNPPMQSLAIICTHLPWTITVTPTRGAIWAAPYVTVGDVLHTLYRTLRLGVTEPELGVLDAAGRDRVHDAYVRRYRRVGDPRDRDAEKAKGIKRVDFLRDHRAFYGMSLVQGGLPAKRLPHGAVWMLHTAKP
ncbi:hypothetical protein L226DRAFT_471583 [Lentinus tigrinus ALCF2SS1-7]|uniref:DUF6699 domain-containing protein n=1 Tax=Lentinus tigrinus ALCF2SS1-6 TaxID=1328759 RepID=A0A5C2S8Y5_9APHY|nr:hypothetical protein L227DRAFT_563574 [Lentinus tigrinus ALCF2SS1-6]RPD69584.1 hypothetical protein L226DRAFT_471583 [Lentinus tigrinus ALCF2SS1-7]